jgi:hypothetical protein
MIRTATDTKNSVTRTALTAALVLTLSGLGSAWGAPPAGEQGRLARKMHVLEKIFDEVLNESPNVFVSGPGATHGLLLEGYGALFTFEGSIGAGGPGAYTWGNFSGAISSYYRGATDFPAPPPKAPKGDEEEILVPDSVDELAQSWEKRREESRKEAQERLDGLRSELIEALLDYGATLNELSDDRLVVVAAFLGGYGFDTDGPEQLVFKGKMRDLRQYSAGQLSLEQARTRIVVEEQ